MGLNCVVILFPRPYGAGLSQSGSLSLKKEPDFLTTEHRGGLSWLCEPTQKGTRPETSVRREMKRCEQPDDSDRKAKLQRSRARKRKRDSAGARTAYEHAIWQSEVMLKGGRRGRVPSGHTHPTCLFKQSLNSHLQINKKIKKIQERG